MPDNLKLRHNTYFVRYRVPAALQAIVGRTEILRTTGHRDRKLARAAEPRIMLEIQQYISRALENRPEPTVDEPEFIERVAETLRESLRANAITQHQAEERLSAAIDMHIARRKDIDPETGDVIDESEALLRITDQASKLVSDPKYRPLTQWVSEYLGTISNLVPATVQGRKTELARFTKWAGADTDVRKFRGHNAVAYVDEVINKWENRAYNTKVAALSKLTAFFAWVKLRAELDSNPFDRVQSQITKSNRGTEKTRRPWEETELVKLLSATFPRPDLAAVTLIALYSGARIDEVCMAKTANINLGKATTTGNLHPKSWRVTSGHGKNASAIRSIPIHSLLAPLVARLVETSWDGYLISGLTQGKSGKLKRSHYLSKRFGDWCDEIGLTDPRLKFHTLRNTFIQRLRRAEVDLSTRKSIVGHVETDMTDGVYSSAEWSKIAEGVGKAEYGAADKAARLLVETLPGNPPKGAIRRETLRRPRPTQQA